MPHIRVRGLKSEQVQALSEKLIPELSEVTGSPVENFTMECIHSDFFAAGKPVTGEPFCEVLWFPREQELQDKVAQMITARLKRQAPALDVVVVFFDLKKGAYYENGVHF